MKKRGESWSKGNAGEHLIKRWRKKGRVERRRKENLEKVKEE